MGGAQPAPPITPPRQGEKVNHNREMELWDFTEKGSCGILQRKEVVGF